MRHRLHGAAVLAFLAVSCAASGTSRDTGWGVDDPGVRTDTADDVTALPEADPGPFDAPDLFDDDRPAPADVPDAPDPIDLP
jgi:hypothetical protein